MFSVEFWLVVFFVIRSVDLEIREGVFEGWGFGWRGVVFGGFILELGLWCKYIILVR